MDRKCGEYGVFIHLKTQKDLDLVKKTADDEERSVSSFGRIAIFDRLKLLGVYREEKRGGVKK